METTKTTFEQYLINLIDGEGYGKNPETEREKLQFLYETFKSEYGWSIQRIGEVNSLKEWLSGLPSSINIPFYYHDIRNILYLFEFITANSEEKYIERREQNWFELVAIRLNQLFEKYNVK